MAKTAGGNPVIGTVVCSDVECTEQATVHQVASGTRKGQLYLRCPECGCDQRKAKSLQKHIRTKADFREGFEHLAESGTGTENEDIQEDEKMDIPEDETPAEQSSGKHGPLAVAGVVVASLVGLALGLGGRK